MPTTLLWGFDSLHGRPGYALLGLAAALGLLAGRWLFRTWHPGRGPSAGRAAPHEPGAERRAEVRYAVAPDRISLTCEGAPARSLEGCLIDRSLGGVGLLLSQPVEPRTVWRLETSNGSAPPVRVEVRYCRLHRGRWRVGCQFVNSPAPAGA